DANASVTDDQQHIGAWLDADMAARVLLIELNVGGLDRQLAAFGHRVASIDGQVDQHLLDLPGVGANQAEIGRRQHYQLDIFADQTAQQLIQTCQQVVRIKNSRLDALLAREGQQLARELRGGGRGVVNLMQVCPLLRACGQRVERQLGVANNRGQQVIEIVGYAAGQPPDALHLAGLEQLRFQTAAVGDIADHNIGQRLVVPHKMPDIDLGWESGAAGTQEYRLELRNGRRVGHGARQLRGAAFALLGLDQ